MKPEIDYAVIILNYNSSLFTIDAINSVNENSISENYIICVVDNCSSIKNELDTIKSKKLSNCIYLQSEENKGYAAGNNYGIRYLLNRYTTKYIVIMNPDVEVLKKGSIDYLIKKLSILPNEYCGAQPLVWTPAMGEAKMQPNIRKILSYSEIIIESSFLLKRVFKKKYSRTIYREEMPYEKEIDFEVPSGCFFIMRLKHFDDVDFFDEDTFLYCEEMILGYKCKQLGYKFRFIPSEVVRHEGGKSTGSNCKRLKWKSVIHSINSVDLFLKKYLQCNILKRAIVRFVISQDFLAKKISYYFR